ncbi:glycosyltransferase [Planktomarina temperata]|nr:glycosyltransferase [Planktomarina temperata]
MQDKIKVTIITAVRNREKVIGRCIDSLNNQTYKNIEHILIDGSSTDNTLSIIKAKAGLRSKIVSEPDDGIYDALNKGLALASGHIVGLLHSDDIFYDQNTVANIVKAHNANPTADGTFGDVHFRVDINTSKTTRINRSVELSHHKLIRGMFPGHTSIFLKRRPHLETERYDPSFRIAGDFEYLTRLYKKHNVTLINMNQPISIMQLGGLSTRGLKSYFIVGSEMITALKKSQIKPAKLRILLRGAYKLRQFL